MWQPTEINAKHVSSSEASDRKAFPESTGKRFSYRQVGFGTRFQGKEGARPRKAKPQFLYENELVVDVGNTCWGYEGETLRVLDHHFHRPDNFPSASAAVLESAGRIAAWVQTNPAITDYVLVTHSDPDFDALCAAFLARSIIEGNVDGRVLENEAATDGAEASPADEDGASIDWYNPSLRAVRPHQRWGGSAGGLCQLRR